MRRGAMVVMAAVVVLGGCADDGPRSTDPPATTAPVATDLAPSQVAASTVAPPAGVPACNVDELEFTADRDSIIRIRNAGSIECEVDVSQSPNRDPLMEPSVWLHPGGDAELAVTADEAGCEQPTTVTSVDLLVNGERVEAPVTVPPACSVTLTAIYTVD